MTIEQAQLGEPTVGEEIDLKMIFATLRRRMWLIISTIVVGIALGGLVTLRMPKLYKASARILIDKSSPQVLPNEVRDVYDLGAPLYWNMQEYYNTQYEIIKGKLVAQKAVAVLGLDSETIVRELEALPPETLEAKVAADPLFEVTPLTRSKLRLLGLDKARDRKALLEAARSIDAVSFVRSAVQVRPVKDSQLVDISVTSADPEAAAQLAEAVANAYLEVNIDKKADLTHSAVNWLSDQVLELTTTLKESENELYEFKKTHNIVSVSLEDRQSMASQTLTALNESLAKLRSERLATESQLEAIRRAREEGKELDSLGIILNDNLVQNLKEGMAKLRQEEAELAVRYTGDHPKLVMVRKKLGETRASFEEEVSKRIAAVEETYRTQLDNERRLKKEIEEQKAEALDLNKNEIEYKRLTRDAQNSRELYNLVLMRQKEATLSQMLRANNVQKVESAVVPGHPSSPDVPKNMGLALLISIVLGLALAFLIDYLDNTLKTEEQVERLLGLPFLGILPSIKGEKRAGELGPSERDRYIIDYPRSSVAECCRVVRTNLMFMATDSPVKTILVTSSNPQEGKSTVAVSLALTMAQSGRRVVVVDTDMRRPRLHKTFNVPNETGISAAIVGEIDVLQAVQPSGIDKLDLVTCGAIPPNPAELVQTEKFASIVAELAKAYDLVVFDSPPVQAVTDALIIGSLVDGVLLVVKASSTSYQAVRRARRSLADVGGRIFGVVLNDVDLENKRSTGYYHYYYYRDGYTKDGKKEAAVG